MERIFKKTKFYKWFAQELGGFLSVGERNEILFRLLEHQGLSRLDWAVAKEIEIDLAQWEHYIMDLKSHKPVQYIVGYEYFAGKKFMVNTNVLIPRPETEELVNWIVEEHRAAKSLNILEIGTGSGCIAISLKNKLPHSQLTATDISNDALQVADHNAQNIGVQVKFVLDDILNSAIQASAFDVIVSNPPYIPMEESSTIETRVKDFEPNIALFTEEKKPLQFYEAILKFSLQALRPQGILYFEIHENYAQDVVQLSKKYGFDTQLRNDIYGKPRMVQAIIPTSN